jgi:hypothetical protein
MPRGAVLRLVLTAACVCVTAVLAAACSSSQPASVTASASASSQPPRPSSTIDWQAQSKALAAAIDAFTFSSRDWSYEPRGDVRSDGSGTHGTIVFAGVTGVQGRGRSLTFDCAQLYLGRPAAREARRDHQPVVGPPIYIRNQYHHSQTLPLASDCAIVPGFGMGATTPTVTPQWLAAELEGFVDTRMPWYCWLVVNAGQIKAVVGQYTD